MSSSRGASVLAWFDWFDVATNRAEGGATGRWLEGRKTQHAQSVSMR